jgi:hypothetical protein
MLLLNSSFIHPFVYIENCLYPAQSNINTFTLNYIFQSELSVTILQKGKTDVNTKEVSLSFI